MDLVLHKAEEFVELDLKGAFRAGGIPDDSSSIAEYFRYTGELVKRMVKPEFLSDSEALSLILLGVVSAAEFYFRSVLAKCIGLCPYCRAEAEQVQVPLVSLTYYSQCVGNVSLSALERKSLASEKELKKEIRNMTGLEVRQNTSFDKALQEFDRLCEVRHVAIHSRGFLGAGAASRFELPPGCPHVLRLSPDLIFGLTKISHNTVRSCNRFLSTSILERWLNNGYLIGDWEHDRLHFESFFRAFAVPEECAHGPDLMVAYDGVKDMLLKRRKRGR